MPSGRVALLLFVFGLLLRVLFVVAGPDGGAGWHVGFQGDAPIWQDQAARLASGNLDAELRLPWRAPAMLWLVSALWDGADSSWPLRTVFLVAGAATAPLLYWLLRRAVDGPTAVLAAGLCAASANLMLLASSAQVAALYVPLALLALVLQARLTASPRAATAVAWGVLHGVTSLLRTENLVCFAVLAAVARAGGVRWRPLLLAASACGLVLLPWQVVAMRKVRAFNEAPVPVPPLSLPWDADALASVRALPGFRLPTRTSRTSWTRASHGRSATTICSTVRVSSFPSRRRSRSAIARSTGRSSTT